MFANGLLMFDFVLHHFLEDAILLVYITPMDEVAPGDEDQHKQDDDGDEHDHESHRVRRALVGVPTASFLVATMLTIVCTMRIIYIQQELIWVGPPVLLELPVPYRNRSLIKAGGESITYN